ncbi:MAG TPA: sugar ABC transporter substrate-binding protein [Candidatus Methylomirabilis sp.]
MLSQWRAGIALCLATLGSSLLFVPACSTPAPVAGPVVLRLGVALTPPELASFEPALEALARTHPEWHVLLETTPQSGVAEKISAQLASGTLPDVVRVQGLMVQPWIRQGAFTDLSQAIENGAFDVSDFYPGALEQFRWQGRLWGLPDTAAPDVVFYNLDMFDAAGIPYPTDEWTYADMRRAAILLTLDGDGRNPTDPEFDSQTVRQWGWNGGITNLWQRHLVQPFGGDFCSNQDCTRMDFTSPETISAVEWWASLVQVDQAAPYDPYSGAQTGVPGDPFVAGKAAMGYNGFFAVGQLNELGTIRYDMAQPFLGSGDQRFTPLSTNGYVVSADTEHPEQAWALVQALLQQEFLEETWGIPGHSVPARLSASDSVLRPTSSAGNLQVILAAMEYGSIFRPYTASALEANAKTAALFIQAMRGELSVAEAMGRVEAIANDVLARDRQP